MPAVVGRQRNAEQMAQFTVKVGQLGLGPGQDADAQIAQVAKCSERMRSAALLPTPGSPMAKAKPPSPDLLLDAPAEALDRRRAHPQSRGRHLWGEGIELETVEIEEFFIHEGFCGCCGLGR